MASTPGARSGGSSLQLQVERLLSLAHAYRPVAALSGLTFASDLAGHAQLYRIEQAGAFPRRLFPNPRRTLPVAAVEGGLLAVQDRDGDEIWQPFLVESDGSVHPLSRDPKAIHRGFKVTADGRRAALAYNPGGSDDWSLGVMRLPGGEIENWLARPGNWQWLGWEESGSVGAVAQVLGSMVNRAHLIRRPGVLAEPILPDARQVAKVFWARGRLFALTDHGRDFVGLVEVDPHEPRRAVRRLLDLPHDVEAAVPSPDQSAVAVIVNEGACDSLRVLSLESGAELWRAALALGVAHSDNTGGGDVSLAWSTAGELFAAWETPRQPSEIWEARTGRRWTLAGDESGLVLPETIEYPSFDSLRVPALHYRLEGRSKGTVVHFHGGPESQSRASFAPQLAMCSLAGFNVLAPNVRGSTGFGAAYDQMDDREKRWDAVRDGVQAARWVRRQGGSDFMAAIGGSYGGFMTLAVLVEAPELWNAAVDIVGIADWPSYLVTTSGWRRSTRTAEYGEPNGGDLEFLRRCSPLARAGEIRAPLLIIHGRNDPRVPLSQAEQIHAALPSSELLVFDDEGHGIVRHANRVRAYLRALEFLNRLAEGYSPS